MKRDGRIRCRLGFTGSVATSGEEFGSDFSLAARSIVEKVVGIISPLEKLTQTKNCAAK